MAKPWALSARHDLHFFFLLRCWPAASLRTLIKIVLHSTLNLHLLLHLPTPTARTSLVYSTAFDFTRSYLQGPLGGIFPQVSLTILAKLILSMFRVGSADLFSISISNVCEWCQKIICFRLFQYVLVFHFLWQRVLSAPFGLTVSAAQAWEKCIASEDIRLRIHGPGVPACFQHFVASIRGEVICDDFQFPRGASKWSTLGQGFSPSPWCKMKHCCSMAD